METKVILIFILCVMVLFFFGRTFIMPIRKIIKVGFNSIIGLIIIFIINLIGTSFNFHIGMNFINSTIIGLLGIPGAIMLILLNIFV